MRFSIDALSKDALRIPDAEAWVKDRLSTHWAVQIPAAASSLETPKPDFSHTNLFVHERGFQARPVFVAGEIVPGFDPETHEIWLTDAHGKVTESCGLVGKTLREGYGWLSRALRNRGASQDIRRLGHDLPHFKVELGAQFSPPTAAGRVTTWFRVADALVKEAISSLPGASEVRIWPHHFDLASLWEPGEAAGREDSPSVNVGFSPGDDTFALPYFYVTPWPAPDAAALPSLRHGRWTTEGFTAAVWSVAEQEPEPDAMRAFLQESVERCRELIGHPSE